MPTVDENIDARISPEPMITFLLFALMMQRGSSQQPAKPANPPTTTTVCEKSPDRGPSLMLVDHDGKCQKGYNPMMSKDKKPKALYCVNSKPAQPSVVCKQVPLPPTAVK